MKLGKKLIASCTALTITSLAPIVSNEAIAACYGYGSYKWCDDGSSYSTYGNSTYGYNSNTGRSWGQSTYGNSTYGYSYGNYGSNFNWSYTSYGSYRYGSSYAW